MLPPLDESSLNPANNAYFIPWGLPMLGSANANAVISDIIAGA